MTLEIMVSGPRLAEVKYEAERIRGLFPNKASISAPQAHRTKKGWSLIYVDILDRALEGVKP